MVNTRQLSLVQLHLQQQTKTSLMMTVFGVLHTCTRLATTLFEIAICTECSFCSRHCPQIRLYASVVCVSMLLTILININTHVSFFVYNFAKLFFCCWKHWAVSVDSLSSWWTVYFCPHDVRLRTVLDRLIISYP